MSDKKNTEIAVNEGFAALANRDVLNEAMADDCQGLEFSFDRMKLPAGGGTAFEIPSAESDESEMAKDITGVIVYNHPAYALSIPRTAAPSGTRRKPLPLSVRGRFLRRSMRTIARTPDTPVHWKQRPRSCLLTEQAETISPSWWKRQRR